jgi:hypothetical protein
MLIGMLRAAIALPLLFPASALAGDDFADTADSLGVSETQFSVVPKKDAKKALPSADEPVKLPTVVETPHRDAGRPFVDPFLGREVYPELSVRLATGFVRKKTANSGESGGNDGTMALISRADVSLWFLDMRFFLDSTEQAGSGPFELVLKAPIEISEHSRLAPMLVVHVPMAGGIGDSIVEAAVGYHYARSRLALKLEVSAFDGAPNRTRLGAGAGGKLGWNAAVSYLVTDRIGVLVEADGVTAVSERTGVETPAVGDTIVRVLPGVRWFVDEASGLELGLAGIFSVVPDGYSVRRDQGVLLDFGYTFF